MTDIIELEMLNDKVKLSIRNNEVSKTSIQTAFLLKDYEEISLKFLLDGQEVACGYDKPYFFLPENWKTLKFAVKPFKPPQRLFVDIEEKPACENDTTDDDEKSTKDIKWFNDLQKYAMYYEDSSNVKHCVTPLTTNLVATYEYEENRDLTTEVTTVTPIIIRSFSDVNYRVPAKVLLKDELFKLVVLQSIDTEFLDKDPRVESPEIGMRYLMLGLSNVEYERYPLSPSIGHCKKILDNLDIVGSTKYSLGNIGAGVWNSSRQLIGMNIMAKNDGNGASSVFISSRFISQKARAAFCYNDPNYMRMYSYT